MLTVIILQKEEELGKKKPHRYSYYIYNNTYRTKLCSNRYDTPAKTINVVKGY